MLQNNIHLKYSVLTILSTGKKCFEAMGRTIGKSGDTIKRILPKNKIIFRLLGCLTYQFFRHKKELVLAIDDTLIQKIYSQFMRGSGRYYDTNVGRKLLAYKVLACGVTDGNYFMPLSFSFLYSKEVCPNPNPSKDALIKQIISDTILFFDKRGITITVAADGAFSTILTVVVKGKRY